MESYLPLLFDAVIVVIFIGYITNGMHKGLLRSVGEFLSTLGAILLSAIGSSILAPMLYNGLFRQGIIQMLDEYLAEVASPEMIISQVQQAIETLPNVVQGAVQLGLDTIAVDLNQLSMLDVAEVSQTVADTIVGPMITAVLELVFFFILFAVTGYILRLFCRALNVFNYIPLVGPLNSLLGAAFGALKAVAVISVLVMVGQFVIAASNNGLELFNSDIIASTMLYGYFVQHNLVTGLLGLLK